jgi:hypothetical protein
MSTLVDNIISELLKRPTPLGSPDHAGEGTSAIVKQLGDLLPRETKA